MRATVVEVSNKGSLYGDGNLWITLYYPLKPFRELNGCLSVDQAIDSLKKLKYKLIKESEGMSLWQAPPEDVEDEFFKVPQQDEKAWLIPETHPAFNACQVIYGSSMYGYRNLSPEMSRSAEESLKADLLRNFFKKSK